MVVGIIGLGLMGGSFGRTLTKNGHTVLGLDKNDGVMQKALLINAINEPLTAKNAKKLDILVSAVLPSQFKDAVSPFLGCLKDGAIVMDFGGDKRGTLCEMKEFASQYKNLNFVGGHPMAGREFSGIEHSITTLFNGASMLLIPCCADIFTLDKLKKFYLSLGFKEVIITDAENHDKMIAYTSQLCHIVSNTYIKNKTASEHFGYSAGSYKDLTRVARLDPNMWSELMYDNADYLRNELDELILNLQDFSKALHNKDKETLRSLLKEGNDRKLSIDERKNK